MKATITTPNAENMTGTIRDRIYNNGLRYGFKAVYVEGGKLCELVDLRISQSKGGTAYAAIWVHGPDMWSSGGGSAGGGGYHKASAAAGSAIRAAGITLDESIHGCGDTAIMKAVEAIGKALAPGKQVIVVDMHA